MWPSSALLASRRASKALLTPRKRADWALELFQALGRPEIGLVMCGIPEAAHATYRQKLPPEFREVVILREIEELSYREIAKVIGKPVGTVMSRLARARGRLQVMLVAGGEC